MSDWIDEFKKQKESREKKQQEETSLRLHKAEIIGAKAPALIAALKGRVAADCEKLRAQFPDDQQFHCTFASRNTGFVLTSHPSRLARSLRVTSNIKGHCIDVEKSEMSPVTGEMVLRPRTHKDRR